MTRSAAPIRISRHEDGHAVVMVCQRMELGEPDESGRRRPVPIPGAAMPGAAGIPASTIPGAAMAEIVFVVDEKFQRLGIATFLFLLLVRLARQRGIQTLVAEVIDNTTSRGRTLRFLYDGSYTDFRRKLRELGQTPLPKYIKRDPEPEDESRYQTIYAKHEGAVAAPTAGLHFSKHLLKRLEIKGIDFAELTLHVGLGTFSPVAPPSTDRVNELN